MATKLSPKMQNLMDALNAGTAKVFSKAGNDGYLVFGMASGFGKYTPTVTALISRGLLVKGTEKGRWVPVAQEAPEVTVESGDKVERAGVKGKVLEVCTRAGVMLAAVAFGFDLVWVKVAELVAL